MAVEAAVLVAYAVMEPPDAGVLVPSATGYAVMEPPVTGLMASSVVGYAVMEGSQLPVAVGQTLGVRGHSWENNPTSFAYQWFRNDVAISGATGATYTLTADDEGQMVSNRIIASNDSGQSDPVWSHYVGPVAAAA